MKEQDILYLKKNKNGFFEPVYKVVDSGFLGITSGSETKLCLEFTGYKFNKTSVNSDGTLNGSFDSKEYKKLITIPLDKLSSVWSDPESIKSQEDYDNAINAMQALLFDGVLNFGNIFPVNYFESDTERGANKIISDLTEAASHMTECRIFYRTVTKAALEVEPQPLVAPYLTLKMTDASAGVPYLKTNQTTWTIWDGTIEYSYDAENWTVWDGKTQINYALSSGNNYYIYLRGTGNTYLTHQSPTPFDYRWVHGRQEGTLHIIGDIMNLLDYQTVARGEVPPFVSQAFSSLFTRVYKCRIASLQLSAKALKSELYKNMFYNDNSATDFIVSDTYQEGLIPFIFPSSGSFEQSETVTISNMFNGAQGERSSSFTCVPGGTKIFYVQPDCT